MSEWKLIASVSGNTASNNELVNFPEKLSVDVGRYTKEFDLNKCMLKVEMYASNKAIHVYFSGGGLHFSESPIGVANETTSWTETFHPSDIDWENFQHFSLVTRCYLGGSWGAGYVKLYAMPLADTGTGSPDTSAPMPDIPDTNPVHTEITEIIRLTFDKTYPVNYSSLSPSNADITHFEWILEDDTRLIINSHEKTDQIQQVKGAVIHLTCRNGRSTLYQIDKTRMAENFFELIAENNLRSFMGEKTSVLDIEELSGIALYKIEYEQYSKDLASWNEEHQRVEELNLQSRQHYETTISRYNQFSTCHGISHFRPESAQYSPHPGYGEILPNNYLAPINYGSSYYYR